MNLRDSDFGIVGVGVGIMCSGSSKNGMLGSGLD